MELKKSRLRWTDIEIRASVDVYLDMLNRELAGQKINKSHENRALRAGPLAERNAGAFEYRMRNISAVLEQMDRPWIAGYKPARNAGPIAEEIIRVRLTEWDNLINPMNHEPTADDVVLEWRAAQLEKHPIEMAPQGIAKPQQSASSKTMFIRDPAVRAWVRQQAEGICEGCSELAPFLVNGVPFLEVHHVKKLADQGSDRTSNAVALCPNCHRRCHHSSDREAFTAALYDQVSRLIREG